MFRPSPSPPTLGTVALLSEMMLCSLLWAPAFILMKRIGTDLSPLALTALRDAMGGGLLALWFVMLGERILPSGREWIDWAVLSLLQVIVPNMLTVYALAEITTSLAALIQASTPIIVAVLAQMIFPSERMTLPRAVGIGLGIAGVLMLLGPGTLAGSERSVPGALAMMGAPVSYALGNLYVRGIPRAEPLRLAYGQMAFSGIPAMAAALLFAGPSAFAAAPAHLTDLFVLSLFATAIPLAMFMRILQVAGPTVGTMVGYLVPLWTILIGVAFFSETLSGREIAGGSLLLVGLAIAAASRPRRYEAT